MERHAFELLSAMERSWWYRARARAVLVAARKAGLRDTETMLDFGAGFGGMYDTLTQLAKQVDAFEPDQEADEVARKRGYRNVFADEAESLRLNAYDCIGAFDVLEHIEDDAGFLVRAHGALREKGSVIITVPAFPFLWSVHDEQHHHFRRYSKSALRQVLTDAGFEVQYIGYWNMCLFIPAAIMRILGRSGEGALSLPSWIDALFSFVLTIERMLMRIVPLPFGISLVVVAKKQ